MSFEFHPEAREEFHDAAHWYEDRSIYAVMHEKRRYEYWRVRLPQL